MNRRRALAFVVIAALLPLTYFRNGLLIIGGDTSYPLDVALWWQRTWSTWSDYGGLGFSNAINTAVLVPYGVVLRSLQLLGAPALLSQALLLTFLNVLAGVSMYLCAKRLLDFLPQRELAAGTAALLYLYNPFSMLNWSAPDPVTLSAYAMFPYVAWLFIRGWQSPRPVRSGMIFGAASILVGTGYLNLPFLALIAATMLAFVLWEWGFGPGPSETRRRQRVYTATAAVCFVLANAYWMLPTVLTLSERATGLTSRGGAQWAETFSAYSSFLRLFQLMGYSGWEGVNNGRPSFSYAWILANAAPYAAIAFLPVLLSLAGLALRPRHPRLVFLGGIFVASMFFAKSLHPPFAFINRLLYAFVPGFLAFSSGYVKFGIVLVFSASLLAGVGLVRLAAVLHVRRPAARRALVVCTTVTWLVNLFPFWTGDVLINGNDDLPSFQHADVPRAYREVADWINRQPGDFKVAAFPPQGGWSVYTWGYVGANPFVTLLQKPLIDAGLTPLTFRYRDIEEELYSLARKKRSVDARELFIRLGIGYVFLHHDVDLTRFGGMTPEDAEAFLRSQPALKFERAFGPIDVFRVDAPVDRFYATSHSTIVFGGTAAVASATTARSLTGDGQPTVFLEPASWMETSAARDPAPDVAVVHAQTGRASARTLFGSAYAHPLDTTGAARVQVPQRGRYAAFVSRSGSSEFDGLTAQSDNVRFEPLAASQFRSPFVADQSGSFLGVAELDEGTRTVRIERRVPLRLGTWRPKGEAAGWSEYEIELPLTVNESMRSLARVTADDRPLNPIGRSLLRKLLGSDSGVTPPAFEISAPNRLRVMLPQGGRPDDSYALYVPVSGDDFPIVVLVPDQEVEALGTMLDSIERRARREIHIFDGADGSSTQFWTKRSGPYEVATRVQAPEYRLSLCLGGCGNGWRDWSQPASPAATDRAPPSSRTPLILLGANWLPTRAADRGWRWGTAGMTLIAINQLGEPLRGVLRVTLDSLRDRSCRIALGPAELLSQKIAGRFRPLGSAPLDRLVERLIGYKLPRLSRRPNDVARKFSTREFTLPPGSSELTVSCDEPPVSIDADLANGDRRSVSVGISEDLAFVASKSGGDTGQATNTETNSTEFAVLQSGDDALLIKAHFDGATGAQPIGILERRLAGAGARTVSAGIDPAAYSRLRFSYRLESPAFQAVSVLVGVSWSARDEADAYIDLESVSDSSHAESDPGLTLVTANLEALATRLLRRDPRQARLTRLVLLLHKRWTRFEPTIGDFAFDIGQVRLESERSVIAAQQSLGWNDHRWQASAEEARYEITRADGQTLGVLMTSDKAGGGDDENASSGKTVFVLNSGIRLTGVLVRTTGDQLILKDVSSNDPSVGANPQSLRINRSDVVLSFPAKTDAQHPKRPTVTLSTSLADIDLSKTPDLVLSYTVQNRNAAYVKAQLGIDVDGDGRVDMPVLAGHPVRIRSWRPLGLAGGGNAAQFEATLPADFVKAYIDGEWTEERIAIYHGGRELAFPQGSWSLAVADGQAGKLKLTLSLPQGEVPDDQYVLVYIPESQQPSSDAAFRTDLLPVAEELDAIFGGAPRLVDVGVKIVHSTAQPESQSLLSFIRAPSFVKLEARDASAAHRVDAAGSIILDGVTVQAPARIDSDAIRAVVPLVSGHHYLAAGEDQGLITATSALVGPDDTQERVRVTARSTGAARYELDVETDGPCWLVFNDSYDVGWRATVRPSPDSLAASVFRALTLRHDERLAHHLVNGYANGWKVPSAGRHHIVVDFDLQRWFNIGLFFSVAQFLAGAIAVAYGWRQ